MHQKIILQYCELMKQNNITSLTELFTKDAQIISPTLGTQTVEEFLYFIDKTKRTEIFLNELFKSQINVNRIAAHVTVNSLWEETKTLQVEAIDIFEFDENNKIKKLEMYYDSHVMRGFLEKLI